MKTGHSDSVETWKFLAKKTYALSSYALTYVALRACAGLSDPVRPQADLLDIHSFIHSLIHSFTAPLAREAGQRRQHNAPISRRNLLQGRGSVQQGRSP